MIITRPNDKRHILRSGLNQFSLGYERQEGTSWWRQLMGCFWLSSLALHCRVQAGAAAARNYIMFSLLMCTLHTAHYTLHTAHCILHTAHCTLHTTHCTLHTAHGTLHTAHYKINTTHCTWHTPHCKLQTALKNIVQLKKKIIITHLTV